MRSRPPTTGGRSGNQWRSARQPPTGSGRNPRRSMCRRERWRFFASSRAFRRRDWRHPNACLAIGGCTWMGSPGRSSRVERTSMRMFRSVPPGGTDRQRWALSGRGEGGGRRGGDLSRWPNRANYAHGSNRAWRRFGATPIDGPPRLPRHLIVFIDILRERLCHVVVSACNRVNRSYRPKSLGTANRVSVCHVYLFAGIA